jgi:hypothetical protein
MLLRQWSTLRQSRQIFQSYQELDHRQRSPLRLILDKAGHASSPVVKRAMKRSKNW